MMPWSGLMPAPAEHANEMGTSELHRTSIMLAARALTTDLSMHPERSHTKEAEPTVRSKRLGSIKPPLRGRDRVPKIT
jgi:hypothetical protein